MSYCTLLISPYGVLTVKDVATKVKRTPNSQTKGEYYKFNNLLKVYIILHNSKKSTDTL